MTDIRIICTHDGLKTAQTLERLLAALEYAVELCYGRNSLEHLEAARAGREAVILVWSVDAPTTLYMRQWAEGIDDSRLIEIARSPNWPTYAKRRNNVIDFSKWNGERAGSAWRALIDRLEGVQHAMAPKGPIPWRALGSMAAASALVVGGASWQRMHDTPPPAPDVAEAPSATQIVQASSSDGMGGSLEISEPASRDDLDRITISPVRAHLLDTPAAPDLVHPEIADPMEFRDPTVLQRLSLLTSPLSDLASPLLRRDDEHAQN